MDRGGHSGDGQVQLPISRPTRPAIITQNYMFALLSLCRADYRRDTRAKIPQQWHRLATAIKALATVRRLLPPALTPTSAGPAAKPAEAGTQEHEAGPKSRRPKAATVRDDRDPLKGAALLKLGRDDRKRES
jgi:hypothetical protein